MRPRCAPFEPGGADRRVRARRPGVHRHQRRPDFSSDEAISLLIDCADHDEIDYYWDDVLSRIWHRMVTAQPAPPAGVIAAAAVVALLLVVVPGLWRRSRHLVTVAHEAAHGIAALATGRRLSGIRLHADTSGLTLSRGRRSGPGMFVTTAAGYAGPALLGLGAAYLLSIRHAVALLWLVLFALVLLLTVIRNWFGLWSVLVAAVVVFAVSWWGSGTAQSGCAYVGAWFLLFAAPRPVLELQASRRRKSARDSDADTLARLTGVPGVVWVGVFLLVTVAALAVGTRLLLAGAAKN